MTDKLKPITVNAICDSSKSNMLCVFSKKTDTKQISIEFDITQNVWSDDIVGRIMAADEFIITQCLWVLLKIKPTPADRIKVTLEIVEHPPVDVMGFPTQGRHYYFDSVGGNRVRLFWSDYNCGEITLDAETFNDEQIIEIHNRIFSTA